MLEIIPTADDYLRESFFIKHYARPIAERVAFMAAEKGYALVHLPGGNRAVWEWDLFGKMVRSRGWRMVCASFPTDNYLLFVPAALDEFTVMTGAIVDTAIWGGLSKALADQDFTLVANEEFFYHYCRAKNRAAASLSGEMVEPVIENPFPDAGFYLPEVRKNEWRVYLTPLVRAEVEEYGYALAWARSPGMSCSLEESLAVLEAFERAGWRVTRIYRGKVLVLVLFTPAKLKDFRIYRSTPKGKSVRALMFDDVELIVAALRQENIVLVNENDKYLEFEKQL